MPFSLRWWASPGRSRAWRQSTQGQIRAHPPWAEFNRANPLPSMGREFWGSRKAHQIMLNGSSSLLPQPSCFRQATHFFTRSILRLSNGIQKSHLHAMPQWVQAGCRSGRLSPSLRRTGRDIPGDKIILPYYQRLPSPEKCGGVFLSPRTAELSS